MSGQRKNQGQPKIFSAEANQMRKRGLTVPGEGGVAEEKTEILEALAEIKALLLNGGSPVEAETVQEGPTPDAKELAILRAQLRELKRSIDETKSEIASLHKPGENEDKFATAALELDAIVRATEVSTNNILGSAEDIQEKVNAIIDRTENVKIKDDARHISDCVINIFENCNFQDITGQRIGKVVGTINYLEDRILSMINIWGEEDFEGVDTIADNRSADEKLLEGPQLEGQGISQNDIDSLFD